MYIFLALSVLNLMLLHIITVELGPHAIPVAFHVHSCRLNCAAIRPQMSPQENFWVLCRGAPRKTLNPSGFYFGAILVSWSGQSGTLFPKERKRGRENDVISRLKSYSCSQL